MNCKKVVLLSLGLLMLLLTFTFGAVARATLEERRTVYSMEYFNGLRVTVEAPYLASPGENITVTVRASGDIDVEYIDVNICGVRNETEEFSLADIYIRTVPYQYNHTITIPNDTSPGLLYGTIRWRWTYMGITVKPPPAGFTVTYVKSSKLEELQAAYHRLLANYTKLKNYKSELGATRNLMYIFIATTVVSAATAFILLIRRPKGLWT